ncbi:MAG: M48 family metalloprotease [Verrucomicrobiales bacterium]|nr:M48 family metalloprotease [Verrucomicrobiales bacterium]
MEINLRKYHDRILEYDNEFKASPLRYKARVFWWIVLGYGIVFGILLIQLLLVGGLIWLQANREINPVFIWCGYGILSLSLIGTIRSLFIRIPLPDGFVISRSDHPYLYDLIESLRKPMRLKKKQFQILVDWDFNAAAISRPALGLFGPSKHYIRFGLPLLASLNENQLKGVLAHELAHLSRDHSGFGTRISRIAGVWGGLLTRLQKHRVSGAVFRLVFVWYIERLNAMMIVLLRNNEYEADKIAAKAVGARDVAQGLMRTGLRKSLIVDDHWKELSRSALIDEIPVDRAVSRLLTRLQSDHLDKDRALDELRWQLGDHTEFHDTHPCLSDRIKAIGIELPDPKDEPGRIIGEWNLLRPESTLRRFLGKELRGTSLFIDRVWFLVNHLQWVMTYHTSFPLAKLMRELDAEWKENGRISVAKAWKRALITERFYGQDKALPIAEYILRLDETHPYANFVKGCQLLRKYDSSGILHLETAIERDPVSYREAGLAILSDYYKRMGSDSDYREAKYESFAASEETHKAIRERERKISASDEFNPHDLSDEELAELAETFAYLPGIRRVHIVTRKVEHLPESKFYVIAIIPTVWGRLFNKMGDLESTDLFPFSHTHRVLALSLTRLILRKKIAAAGNSLLYRRRFFERHRIRQDHSTSKAPKFPTGAELRKREEMVMQGINPRTGTKI